MKSLLNL
jgi:hypothetical protein